MSSDKKCWVAIGAALAVSSVVLTSCPRQADAAQPANTGHQDNSKPGQNFNTAARSAPAFREEDGSISFNFEEPGKSLLQKEDALPPNEVEGDTANLEDMENFKNANLSRFVFAGPVRNAAGTLSFDLQETKEAGISNGMSSVRPRITFNSSSALFMDIVTKNWVAKSCIEMALDNMVITQLLVIQREPIVRRLLADQLTEYQLAGDKIGCPKGPTI